jgi:8-oxo-dGTP pyrophosphatase MutT (NUDIX family)
MFEEKRNFFSVGVVIYDKNNKFLLQKRDKKQSIYFPGCWGLFGGACNSNEKPENAAIRELNEELSIKFNSINFLLSLKINSMYLGNNDRTRLFYTLNIKDSEISRIVLTEGEKYKFFDIKNLVRKENIVPFDLCAIKFFYQTNISKKIIIPA